MKSSLARSLQKLHGPLVGNHSFKLLVSLFSGYTDMSCYFFQISGAINLATVTIIFSASVHLSFFLHESLRKIIL